MILMEISFRGLSEEVILVMQNARVTVCWGVASLLYGFHLICDVVGRGLGSAVTASFFLLAFLELVNDHLT